MKFDYEMTLTLNEAIENGYVDGKVFEIEDTEKVLDMVSAGICKADKVNDFGTGDLLFEIIRNVRSEYGLDD